MHRRGFRLFAWRRVVDPATALVQAQQLAPIAGAAAIIAGRAQPGPLGVRRVDAHTLEVRLASPTPYFLYLLTNCWLMPLHRADDRARMARLDRARATS